MSRQSQAGGPGNLALQLQFQQPASLLTSVSLTLQHLLRPQCLADITNFSSYFKPFTDMPLFEKISLNLFKMPVSTNHTVLDISSTRLTLPEDRLHALPSVTIECRMVLTDSKNLVKVC